MPFFLKKSARTVTHECHKVNSGGYLLFIVQSEHKVLSDGWFLAIEDQWVGVVLQSAIYLFGKY